MTAKIVTVFNQKGGCGKTMTSMQLGAALGLMGKSVYIADMDRQGTSTAWSGSAAADNPFPATVTSLAPQKENFINELAKLVNLYDLIIVDCPPAIESTIPWAALQVADIAVIPFIPTMDNVWASNEARDLAAKASKTNVGLRSFFLPSNVQRTNVHKTCIDLLGKDEYVQMLKSRLYSRTVYQECQFHGASVHGFSRSSPAALEVDELAEEILELLGVDK